MKKKIGNGKHSKMTVKRLLVSVATMGLSVVMLSGCFGIGKEKDPKDEPEKNGTVTTDDGKKDAESNQVVINPVQGGELSLAMRSPKTLNPLLNEDRSVGEALKLMFEHLVKIDETLKPYANSNIVETMEVAADGLSINLVLKSGVKWSDGVEMKAADVAYSFETLRGAEDTVVYKNVVQNVTQVNVIDEYTVKINLMQPFGGSVYLLNFPIIPKHYYDVALEEGVDEEEGAKIGAHAFEPVGNGAFSFVSYTMAENLMLKANETASGGRPYIDTVKVVISQDSEGDMNLFDQNITNVVAANISEWTKYTNTKDTEITEYSTTFCDFIGFNFNRVKFQDKSVREAVAYAMPIDEMMATVYLDYAERAKTPVHPSSWLFEGDTKERVYSLEQAKAVLTAGGWVDDTATGIMKKQFAGAEGATGTEEQLTVSILVNSENLERSLLANMLVDKLKEVGFNAVVDQQDFATYSQKIADRDYDMFIGGYSLSMVPDLSFMFSSQKADTTNLFSYKNEAMDGALASSFGAIGDINFQKGMSDVQKIVAEEIPCIGLVFRKSAVFTDVTIHGTKKPAVDDVFDNIREWFIINDSEDTPVASEETAE